jgi:tetratricopeptide (TPR) repeat protein
MMSITQISGVRFIALEHVLTYLLLSLFASTAFSDEAVDHIALAERLYADGHIKRAQQVLSLVNAEAEDADLRALNMISGLIDLQQQSYQSATQKLNLAIELGERRSLVFLGLAQAHYYQQKFGPALIALKRAQPIYGGNQAGYLMAAQCHWAQGMHGHALAILEQGQQYFDAALPIIRQAVLYLVELELYHQAIIKSDELIRHKGITAGDVLAVAHALRSAGQYYQVITLLERARMYHPQSDRLSELLAHTYLTVNKPFTAGMLFGALAQRDAKYAYETAQAYKSARRFVRALAANTKVPAADKRFKQRLSILVDDGRFFEVGAMEKTLERLDLLKDDEIRYALAYAHFKSASGKRAKHHLNAIEDAKMLEQVSALRRSIVACEESGWECL